MSQTYHSHPGSHFVTNNRRKGKSNVFEPLSHFPSPSLPQSPSPPPRPPRPPRGWGVRKWSKSIAFLFPPLISHKMAAWMRMHILQHLPHERHQTYTALTPTLSNRIFRSFHRTPKDHRSLARETKVRIGDPSSLSPRNRWLWDQVRETRGSNLGSNQKSRGLYTGLGESGSQVARVSQAR